MHKLRCINNLCAFNNVLQTLCCVCFAVIREQDQTAATDGPPLGWQ